MIVIYSVYAVVCLWLYLCLSWSRYHGTYKLETWHSHSSSDSLKTVFSNFYFFFIFNRVMTFFRYSLIYSLVIWRLTLSELMKLRSWNFVYGLLLLRSIKAFQLDSTTKIIRTGNNQIIRKLYIICSKNLIFGMSSWYRLSYMIRTRWYFHFVCSYTPFSVSP